MLKPFKNSDLMPISEAYRMIYEDAESKNRHAARSWIRKNHPESIGRRLQNGIDSSEELICRELTDMMDNVKLADYKFLQGLARIYFTDMKNRPNDMVRMANKLNGILKIISVEPHLSEYDRNLNGLSFKELDDRFSKAVKKNLEDDKSNIDRGSYSLNSDYEIVKINSFKKARKYGKYTSWCVTHSEENYDAYTRNGLGIFYFCLKKGFEDVPQERGEGCPLDEYGLSMIAVLVGDDGSLWHCTCRWNHANGGNDNIMDTQQISELLGVNFYDTFKPKSVEELMAKYNENRLEDDDFCRKYGYIKVCDMDEEGYSEKDFYVRAANGTIERLMIVGDGLCYDEDGGFIKTGPGPYTIDANAFGRNLSLKKVDIPYGVTSIGEYAFFHCTNLTSVTIPDTVEEIGWGAFSDCYRLVDIAIPDSVTSIDTALFANCNRLRRISIPDSLTTIERSMFSDCSSLVSVDIPDSITNIESFAFNGCRRLKELRIPDSVQEIGDSAFSGCESLTSIVIPDGVKNIGIDAFFDCDNLTSVTIPDTVEEIGHHAFCNCGSLTSITIPDSVTTIGAEAFSGCSSLKTINASPKIVELIREQTET